MVFRLLIIAALAGLILPAGAQLASDSIAAARKYSGSHNGKALIVKEQGLIRFEDYYNGYEKGDPLHIYSGTKSFFGVLAVIAEEDRLLSLDDKAAETLVEWRDDPRRSTITIRDLLNFTSGLETGFDEIYGRGSEDKIALAIGLEAERDRGAAFLYGPGNMNAFSEILRRKLASKNITYHAYLRRELIDPLGIRIEKWREDDQGNPVPSAGIYTTAQEWMKFGDFINAGGVRDGRRIVKAENLAQCFRGTEINPAFGLCFWLNGYAGQPGAREVDPEEWLDEEPMPEDWRGACLSKNAPRDLVCSLGSTFQRLYMVPSMDLVVVHHGHPGHAFRDAEFLRILFEDADIPEAVEPETEPKRGLPKLFKKLRGE